MTVTTETSSARFTNIIDGTPLACPFPAQAASQVVVRYGADLIAADGVHYSVALAGDFQSFTVTPLTGFADLSEGICTVAREVPYLQDFDLLTRGEIGSSNLVKALDYLTFIGQQLKTLFARVLLFPATDAPASIGPLPSSTERANLFLAFDGVGKPVAAALTTGIVAISTWMRDTVLLLTAPLEWRVLMGDAVSPRDFGAVPNLTDAATAAANVTALINALQSGYDVDGGGRLYAVSGNVQPADGSLDGLSVYNLRLLDTNPTRVNARTLYLKGMTDTVLSRPKVDCGGDFTGTGYITAKNGIRIEDCDDITVIAPNVSNGGPISGIYAVDSTHLTFEAPSVHDMHYSDVTIATDCMGGLSLVRCDDVTVNKPKIRYLTGTGAVAQPTRWTRGIGVAACTNFLIDGGSIHHVDQAVDITGSDGNRDFIVKGMNIHDVASNGIKAANSAHHGEISHNNFRNVGVAAVVISGPSSLDIPVTEEPRAIFVAFNRAFNCGGLGSFQCLATAVPYNATYPDPRDIVFAYNYADGDVSGTFNYGHYTNIVPTTDTTDPNFSDTVQLIGARAKAYDLAEQIGFQFPICIVRGNSAAVGIADTTWITPTWNTNVSDSMGMHSLTVDTDTINVKVAGHYIISARACFVTNAVGYRQVEVFLNGALVGNVGVAFAGAGAPTIVETTIRGAYLKPIDRLVMKVWQNSGGALNLDETLSEFSVEKTD